MLCILFGCNEFALISCFFIYNIHPNIIYINLQVLHFTADHLHLVRIKCSRTKPAETPSPAEKVSLVHVPQYINLLVRP